MDSTALRAALASCRAHQSNVEASIAANLARHSRGGPGSGDTELDARVTELRALLLPASSPTSSTSSSSSSSSSSRTSSSLAPVGSAASGAPPPSSGTSSIDAAMAEGLSLVQKLDETADLAARVSKNVRRLDDSQSRVASALQRVRDIKGIKDCVGGLQHAIASLDFEVAVPHLHRFHSIKDAMPSDSTDFLQMERLEGELKGKMTHALDRAAAAGDAAEVLRCCRLFGELENAEAGLRSYTSFVRGAMAREAAAEAEAAAGAVVDGSALLTRLTAVLNRTAQAIQNGRNIVQENFSGGSGGGGGGGGGGGETKSGEGGAEGGKEADTTQGEGAGGGDGEGEVQFEQTALSQFVGEVHEEGSRTAATVIER